MCIIDHLIPFATPFSSISYQAVVFTQNDKNIHFYINTVVKAAIYRAFFRFDSFLAILKVDNQCIHNIHLLLEDIDHSNLIDNENFLCIQQLTQICNHHDFHHRVQK